MTSARRETPQETTGEERKLEVTIRLHVKDKEMRLDAAAAAGLAYLGVILALREEHKKQHLLSQQLWTTMMF